MVFDDDRVSIVDKSRILFCLSVIFLLINFVGVFMCRCRVRIFLLSCLEKLVPVFQRFLVLCLLCIAIGQGSVLARDSSPDVSSFSGGSGPVTGNAVRAVGPGDMLRIVVLGQPELTTDLTVTASGEITAPFLGTINVENLSPEAIARKIAKGMKDGGFLRSPQVVVEVTQVRSRLASIYGEIQRPGRYAIEGSLSLLELLALAGGVRNGADDRAVLMRRAMVPGQPREQLEFLVGNRIVPTREVQDVELQPGDVVFIPTAPRFYIYGEVGQPGAYPAEQDLNIMRALALAGGVNARGSESRILIRRVDEFTGEMQNISVELSDPVLPGDVIYVNERWF